MGPTCLLPQPQGVSRCRVPVFCGSRKTINDIKRQTDFLTSCKHVLRQTGALVRSCWICSCDTS
ncbi:hypothetical protein DPMN_081810 [Dreissena polymorpha]|uniref:Uncharacterized protein n=1 Tax=Dreissena polymorpha TaxID=45954 RepID=A0A9D3Y6K2_DREPO|nr:hypothetical protein DPMN_081809 [Dreissena polymorpha]KAH3694370.1 hypothetical protein DPMN_081810 [Dreissena polymorpha]